MTKTRILLVTLALFLTAETACLAGDAQMGTWKLNEGKSKLVPGMNKNITVVYATDGDKIKATLDGVGKDGKPTHGVWVGMFDGKFYALKGNLPYDQLMYKVVNDRTMTIAGRKSGKDLWAGDITVAKDGKSRVVLLNGTDASGKKFKSRGVYDKE